MVCVSCGITQNITNTITPAANIIVRSRLIGLAAFFPILLFSFIFPDVYKRQVFNTFGALAIAAETYGLQGAVTLREIQNVFGVVCALAFCVIFYWFMSKKKESDVTVHAE